jgi:hypothetical protein
LGQPNTFLASVAEAGDLAYTTYSAVTVYGLDRYGNQILGNENEADGLIVKLQTACDKPAVLFHFIWESDNTIPGTFSTVGSPNYGGPVTVSVLYNAEHAMGGQAIDGGLVGGVPHAKLAKLGIAAPLPNTGLIVGA